MCIASASYCSTSASSRGIHELDRWQFCSTIHVPRSIACAMRRSAIGPCPCPSEIVCSFFDILVSSANFRSASSGSAPGESTKTIGIVGVESLKHTEMSKGGGSMKRSPRLCVTNDCIPGTTLSGRTQRSTHIF